jgi:hypothetical protein
LYPTRFASPQGTLFPGHPHDVVVLSRPQQLPSPGRRHDLPLQLWLFELLQLA